MMRHIIGNDVRLGNYNAMTDSLKIVRLMQLKKIQFCWHQQNFHKYPKSNLFRHNKWSYVCETLLTLIRKLSINIVQILQICGFLLNKCWRQQNSLSFPPSLMSPAQTHQILYRMGGGFFETPQLWEPRKGSAWLGLKVGFFLSSCFQNLSRNIFVEQYFWFAVPISLNLLVLDHKKYLKITQWTLKFLFYLLSVLSYLSGILIGIVLYKLSVERAPSLT